MQSELRQVADLALFAKIVQTGGISRCADDLGMERTTISRRLGALERALGVKLIYRRPKHFSLTEAGLRCLKDCEQLLESARNAHSLATVGKSVSRTVPIVVGAPSDIIERYLDVPINDFESNNPGLSVERHPVANWTKDVVESVDFGIALAPVATLAGWVSKVGEVQQSVYASADYVRRHKSLNSPADIEAHDCIVELADGGRQYWRFTNQHKITKVTIDPKHSVTSLLEAREATLAGLGICRLPHYLCEPYVRAGQLVDLLPHIESVGRDVVMIGPRRPLDKEGATELRIQLEAAFA